jgi:2-polyprenyl-3-methyl-5-hydroxy-6-metoxy-1,4-benzoquinol methylase
MTDWKVILNRIQNHIEWQSIPHYRNAYRKEEFHYWQHIPEWIFEDAQEHDVKRVLDVGCAYGTLACFAKMVYKCEVQGVDVQKYLDDAIWYNYDLTYQILDIETEINKLCGKYDRIIFTEVLEHLFFNPTDTLRNLKELLEDDGLLYLSTPDAAEWGKVVDGYNDMNEMPYIGQVEKPDFKTIDRHLYQYNTQEIHQLIKDAGFKIEKFAYSKPGQRARHFNYQLAKE